MVELRYPLRTARLLLRPYIESDFDDMYDIQSRPEVARYLYWGPRSHEQVRQSIEQRMRSISITHEGDELTLAVVLPETGRVIGDVLLVWTSRMHRQGEIGYVFHPHYGGKGYATEAARAAVDWALPTLPFDAIVAVTHPDNAASRHVLAKLGFTPTGHADSSDGRMLVFQLRRG
jgi:RimJ/RimL family protein N-acetyltransferase